MVEVTSFSALPESTSVEIQTHISSTNFNNMGKLKIISLKFTITNSIFQLQVKPIILVVVVLTDKKTVAIQSVAVF